MSELPLLLKTWQVVKLVGVTRRTLLLLERAGKLRSTRLKEGAAHNAHKLWSRDETLRAFGFNPTTTTKTKD